MPSTGWLSLDGGTISYAHDDSETTDGELHVHRHRPVPTRATVLVTITRQPLSTDLPVLLLIAVALGVWPADLGGRVGNVDQED